jgi:YfiH family protein
MNPAFFLDESGLHADAFTKFDWLEHAFGTRNTPWPDPLVTVKQVHSVIVEPHRRGTGCIAEADGITSVLAGIALGVKTADCLPVLIVDPQNRAVAAVHAGWRGVAGAIALCAIAQLRERFGSHAGELQIAIGPGIGPCCFEVGPEVAEKFGREGRVKIDLSAFLSRQLASSGIPEGNIHSARLCTVCHPQLFHSFRRDGETAGRMMSVVGIKKEPRALFQGRAAGETAGSNVKS